MTVINGCAALNELQAERGSWKCTLKASPNTHTLTHTTLSCNKPYLHANQSFLELTLGAAQEYALSCDHLGLNGHA